MKFAEKAIKTAFSLMFLFYQSYRKHMNCHNSNDFQFLYLSRLNFLEICDDKQRL